MGKLWPEAIQFSGVRSRLPAREIIAENSDYERSSYWRAEQASLRRLLNLAVPCRRGDSINQAVAVQTLFRHTMPRQEGDYARDEVYATQ